MDQLYPIYTEETECQDCYKCVRMCPVKAIRVENGHAIVMSENCIACGICTQVCPASAKKIRNDVGRSKTLISSGKEVYVSLAPSWKSEFPDVSDQTMIKALKDLGFAGVSETALGAEEVSATINQKLSDGFKGLILSSACPVVVNLVCKYVPEFTAGITGIPSPAMVSGTILRREFGSHIAVVFIGPCIAKKSESDLSGGTIDLSLTFTNLKKWFVDSKTNLQDLEISLNQPSNEHTSNNQTLNNEASSNQTLNIEASTNEAKGSDERWEFVPAIASEGALYPIEGGMIETIKLHSKLPDEVRYINLSGVKHIEESLKTLVDQDLKGPVFIEGLACYGGCISGPGCDSKGASISGRLKVEEYARRNAFPAERLPQFVLGQGYESSSVDHDDCTEEQIRDALQSIGKASPTDELNCSGCGYESCRHFAKALVSGTGETSMCVSYLRKQSNKKANALLRCMPSSVVIVDENLSVVECNKRFARYFVDDYEMLEAVRPDLHGASLVKLIPFAEMFATALKTGGELVRENYSYKNALLNITIFTIEPGKVVGAIILDVTQREFKRGQIAVKARQVIDKNISAVQQIACLLGEHMADTEILLRSIAEDYGQNKQGDKGE